MMRHTLTVGALALSTLALMGCASGRPATTHEVVYSVSSDGDSSTSISYVAVTGADVSLAQADDATLPWSTTVQIAEGAFSPGILRLEGRLGANGSTITCDISVDGTSIATKTSTGQFAAVTCSASE